MSRSLGFALAVALCLGAAASPPVWAETVEGPDLWVIAPDDAQAAAVEVRDAFPGILADIEGWLGKEAPGHVDVYLVQSEDEMADIVGLRLSPWAAGACSPPGVIALRLDLIQADPRLTLRSMLVHEVVHHVIHRLPRPPPPRWFDEGLAVIRSGGLTQDEREQIAETGALELLEPLASYELPEAEEWNAAYLLVYVAGPYAVEYLVEEYGEEGLRRLIDRLQDGQPFERAFTNALGLSVAEFERAWRASLDEQEEGSSVLGGVLVVAWFALLFVGYRVVRRRSRRLETSPRG